MKNFSEQSLIKVTLLFVFSTLFTSFPILGHEGHQHDAPKTLVPLKGGIDIKQYTAVNKLVPKEETVTCFVEVAKSGKKGLKIYFFDQDQKNKLAKDFQLTAWASPYKKNAKEGSQLEPLIVEANDKSMYYETSFENKANVHRYHLILKFKGADYCQANEEITFLIDTK